MVRSASLFVVLLWCLNTSVFAEENAGIALQHTNAAVEQGKAGHVSVLVEHAEVALDHAKKAAELSKGGSKTHLEAAVQSLENSIDHGKLGHADLAAKSAEEAIEHLRAGNK